MKKIFLALTIVTLIASHTPVVLAYSSVHVSSPHVSSPHVSTPHTTYHSTPHPTPAPHVSSSSRSNSTRVGTSALHSRTTPPRPNVYNGKTYNSSAAQYTNTSGNWVLYWLLFTNASGGKETQCFDKDHKRVTCNRDKNSYQKDW